MATQGAVGTAPQARQQGNQQTSLAQIRNETVDRIESMVQGYLKTGQIHLPDTYSASNALRSAWIALQTTLNADKQPVLTACTRASIANTLLDMVVQGLNPAKKQCYFIAYGQQLTCQRSYFGTMTVAEMLDPKIEDIVAEVIYEGDEFEYEIQRGLKIVTKHHQSLGNINPQKIVGAYATVFWKDGRQRTEIMPLAQIHQSWKQSRQSPFDEKGNLKSGSVHAKFTADMAMRTVISKVCKPIINASNDSEILRASLHRSDDIADDAAIEGEIVENANREDIDLAPEPTQTGAEQVTPAASAAPAPEAEPAQGDALFGGAGTAAATAPVPF